MIIIYVELELGKTNQYTHILSIRPDEWTDVGEWMWENRTCYNGLTVLPADGGTYKQPPFEDCSPEKFQVLFDSLKEINLTEVVELDDDTNLSGELACSGGACELI